MWNARYDQKTGYFCINEDYDKIRKCDIASLYNAIDHSHNSKAMPTTDGIDFNKALDKLCRYVVYLTSTSGNITMLCIRLLLGGYTLFRLFHHFLVNNAILC